MAYDLEEQEQIASFKAFWNQYGNLILTVITVALLAVAGYRGWGWYQGQQAGQAAVEYERLRVAAERKDVAAVKASAGTLFERYGGTVYGQMAALVAAGAYQEAGDLKAAKAPLKWAADNAADESFRQVARLRLAGVLLDEQSYDEALALLDVASAGRHAGAFADRRGDVLLAQGKRDDAKSAYEAALKSLDADSPLRRVVQLKLDDLGGEAK